MDQLNSAAQNPIAEESSSILLLRSLLEESECKSQARFELRRRRLQRYRNDTVADFLSDLSAV